MPSTHKKDRNSIMQSDWAALQDLICSGDPLREDEAIKFLLFKELPKIQQWVEENESQWVAQVQPTVQRTSILYFKFVLDQQILQSLQNGDTFFQLFLYLLFRQNGRNGVLKNVDKQFQAEWDGSPLVSFLLSKDRQWVKEIWRLNSDACQDVMKKMTFYRHPIKQIVVDMGYKSQEMARTRHFQCFEALKRAITTKPQFESLFRKYLNQGG